MIISDINKFIFLHIPKCGGTTIRESLMKFETRNNFYWNQVFLPGPSANDPKLSIDKGHMTIPIFKKLFPDDYLLTNEYTVFAFTRNPVNRLISAFLEPRRELLENFIDNSEDHQFRKKLQSIFNNYLEFLLRQASFLKLSFLHATPQNFYISSGGKVITDFTIKLEEPSKGLDSLSIILPEVAQTISYALKNKKLRTSTSDSFFLWENTEKDLKFKFVEFYKIDFSLLGYDKPSI